MQGFMAFLGVAAVVIGFVSLAGYLLMAVPWVVIPLILIVVGWLLFDWANSR